MNSKLTGSGKCMYRRNKYSKMKGLKQLIKIRDCQLGKSRLTYIRRMLMFIIKMTPQNLRVTNQSPIKLSQNKSIQTLNYNIRKNKTIQHSKTDLTVNHEPTKQN